MHVKWLLYYVWVILFQMTQGKHAFKARASNEEVLFCHDNPDLEQQRQQRSPDSNWTLIALKHGLSTECPCAYDLSGKCRQAKHMCTTTKNDFYCKIEINSAIISRDGAIIQQEYPYKFYSFSHDSMSGMAPRYTDITKGQFAQGYADAYSTWIQRGKSTREIDTLPQLDMVVPLRMRWDDCFNHLSFQAVPLIAHVKELWKPDEEMWRQLYWHASFFTAGVLRLLDVPEDRIIIERTVRARKVVLPWMQGWCPLQVSSVRGIARGVSELVTRNLLMKSKVVSATEIGKPVDGKRNVVYVQRPLGKHNTRQVINEEAIVAALKAELDLTRYNFVLLPHTPEAKTIDGLHNSWRESAEVFHNAFAIIGPHGAAFNNVIWAPRDVHLVEYNEFPDDNKQVDSHGQTAVRPTYMLAQWMHSTEGRYWVVQPAKKHYMDMYAGRLEMCIREILQVLQLIGGGLLRENVDLDRYPKEEHGTFPRPTKGPMARNRKSPPRARRLEEVRPARQWQGSANSLPVHLQRAKYSGLDAEDSKLKLKAEEKWCQEMARYFGIIPGVRLGSLPRPLHKEYMAGQCFRFNEKARKQHFIPPSKPDFSALDAKPESNFFQRSDFKKACESTAGFYISEDLQQKRGTTKVLFMAAANYGYREFLMNFNCHAKRVGVKFLPIAMDRKIFRYIKRNELFPATFMIPEQVNTTVSGFGTKNFNTIGCRKMEIVLGALKLGYDVIFSDIDIVMMQDPLPYVFMEGIDYAHSQNNLCGVGWRFTDAMEGNTGFYAVRSKPETIRAWEYTVKVCLGYNGQYDDQTTNWLVLRALQDPKVSPADHCPLLSGGGNGEGRRSSTGGSSGVLTTCPLNDCLFSAGSLKDVYPTALRNLTSNLRKMNRAPVMLHGNWVKGSRLKKHALERTGLWLANRKVTPDARGDGLVEGDGDGDSDGSDAVDVGRRKKQLEAWTCGAPSGVFFDGGHLGVPRH